MPPQSEPLRSHFTKASRLLLGIVAFWWGAVVVPRLISLAAPARLPPSVIPAWTDPHWDGQVADLVLAGMLLAAAVLSLVACCRRRTSPTGLAERSGWAVLALTILYLSWAEVSDHHALGLDRLQWEVVGVQPFETSQARESVAEFAPLFVAFLLAMGVFLWKGVRDPSVRLLLAAGLLAWFLAVMLDESHSSLFQSAATELAWLCEETLEFGGALLIGWGAVASLRLGVTSEARGASDAWHMPLVASGLAVTFVGVLAIAFVFRPPLADGRLFPPSRDGAFDLHLADGESVVQDLGVLPAPLGGVDLRMSSHGPSGQAHSVIWRIADAGGGSPRRFLVHGRTTVPQGRFPGKVSITFPQVTEAAEGSLSIQLVADVGPSADLRIGATNIDLYQDGRFWINGEQAWPNQNLEFVARGVPEPSMSKLRALGRLLASGWRWPLLFTALWAALTMVFFVPALLVLHALRTISTGRV